MVLQIKKGHPALKHGGYAAMSILPGESAADFEKLHKDLIEEHRPDGATEIHNVAFLAQLLWRRQNLETIRIAEIARRRYTELMETVPDPYTPELMELRKVDPVEREAAMRAAEDQARKELGSAYKLARIDATVERLMDDLAVLERLNASIDKCLRQLLLVRGLKSISAASSAAPPKSLPSRAA